MPDRLDLTSEVPCELRGESSEPHSCLGKSIVGCGDSSKSRIPEKGTRLDLALDMTFISGLGLFNGGN